MIAAVVSTAAVAASSPRMRAGTPDITNMTNAADRSTSMVPTSGSRKSRSPMAAMIPMGFFSASNESRRWALRAR